MTYDNIKSHKKPRLHPLFEIYIFGLYLCLIYLLPNGGVILTFSLLGVHADFSYVLYKLNVTIILLLNCFSIFNQTLLSSERFLKLFKLTLLTSLFLFPEDIFTSCVHILFCILFILRRDICNSFHCSLFSLSIFKIFFLLFYIFHNFPYL